MESVAAERLNKIGKNPSIVSNRADFEDDINTVNELIMQTTPLASSSSELSLGPGEDGEMKEKKKKRSYKLPISLRKSKSDCHVGGKESKDTLHAKSSREDCSRDEQESLV